MSTNGSSDVPAEFERDLAAAHDLAAALTSVSVSEVADDHTLTVTVGPGNQLVALELTQQALRHEPGTLSTLIVETTARASQRLLTELPTTAPQAGADSSNLAGMLTGELPTPGDFTELDDEDDDDLDELLDQLDELIEERGQDDTLQSLQAMARNAAEQHARYTEMYDELQAMTATGTGTASLVTATVGHGNTLRSLEFSPSAFRHGPTRLAGFILSAVQQASAELSLRITERLTSGLSLPIDLGGLVRQYQPDDTTHIEGLSGSADRIRPGNDHGRNSDSEWK